MNGSLRGLLASVDTWVRMYIFTLHSRRFFHFPRFFRCSRSSSGSSSSSLHSLLRLTCDTRVLKGWRWVVYFFFTGHRERSRWDGVNRCTCWCGTSRTDASNHGIFFDIEERSHSPCSVSVLSATHASFDCKVLLSFTDDQERGRGRENFFSPHKYFYREAGGMATCFPGNKDARETSSRQAAQFNQ